MTHKTPHNDQSQKEWDNLQRDLDTLGEQLRSLRDHSAALGDTLVSELEARYQDVRNRALSLHNATESQLDELRKIAVEQAMQTQSTLAETGARSAEMAKDTARQMWERSEPFRQGAQEVGQGLVRAWTEIAASFGKAVEKVQSERAKSPSREESKNTN